MPGRIGGDGEAGRGGGTRDGGKILFAMLVPVISSPKPVSLVITETVVNRASGI